MTTKKQYTTPSTTMVEFHSGFVCQVTSVRGGLGFGGKGDSIDPM
jgi:hypothetical protein